MAINCKLKKNKNKASCRRKNYVKQDEYTRREIVDNYIYIPIFLALLYFVSYMNWIPMEDTTTLLWVLGIGAISSTIGFLISKFYFMRGK